MEKYTVKSFRQSINEDRFLYYGIAILLVVFYHLHCYTNLGIVAPFSHGAIGVDIFLFFSGYGLCYSYEKNSLKEFYWRRFKRIMPIFWIHFFLTVIEYFSCGGAKFTLLEFLCNFLCIPPFYGIGGTFVDWFTAAILQFYLFFPILYLLVKKVFFPIFLIFVLFAMAMLYQGNLTWQQYCFIDRIPIFLIGIAFYLYPKEKTKLKWLLSISFCIGVAVLLWRHVPYRSFLAYSLTCPLLIFLIYLIIANRYIVKNRIVCKILNKINSFGKSSLEIYYGNGNANIAMRFCQNSYEIFIVYALLTILYSYILYCVNKDFKRLL